MAKVRLDVLLVNRGLFPSREAARRAIMAGLVRRNTEVVDKPGTFVRADEPFEVSRPGHQYVGRGGLKLERAIQAFGIDLHNRTVLDVGASTGGFTDCALQHGAAQVFAVDVGYGQLDWKLRNDERVIVMERTNFRHVTPDMFQPRPTFAVMDVSFISTRLLFPKLQEILQDPVEIVCLIKPQFEAGRDKVGKGGIVRDPVVHLEVLTTLVEAVEALGLQCCGLDYSPISGGDGNIEYLSWWRQVKDVRAVSKRLWAQRVESVVRTAWSELKGESVVETLLRYTSKKES